ncbi:MAG TPA: RHS repeat-associated core domain-containing protein [Candidatus Saccharimonadales bacterium]|nr:RHS repeat-associated core domain-containing protein [Candidatus Saccharimonadales bacterium]
MSETTIYVGAFEAVTTGGVTKYRYHLSADSRGVAEVDLSNSGSSVVEKISYVLSDHLGSTDVVETTDVNGNVLSTTDMSFGAFGNRREPGTWLPPVGSSEAQADHQADRYGFTHQEMLDNVGIIHMNGRIYDPNLGRFLSVDPVFEFPTNTQSLNPYSYVLNNPLSYTDPTGYVADSCGTGKTSCTDSITVKTTAHELGSHIATHGNTTFTGTLDKNGNLHVSASGNGFGLGQTAEVSVDSHGGGNGAQMTQSATSAQTQPTTHTDIGSPANQSLGCTQIVCSGNKIDLSGSYPYHDPHDLQTSDAGITTTENNEQYSQFPYFDPKGSKTQSVGYGYHLDSLTKIRLYQKYENKDGGVTEEAADILTRNFERTYVHSVIARGVHVGLTQGQYDAASDYIYQHGHLPAPFLQDVNHYQYFRASFELLDPNFPTRTGQDAKEFLEATPEYSLHPSLLPNE